MILHCKVTKSTAAAIAKMLNVPAVNPYKEYIPHKDKVVRWGVSKGLGYTPVKVLNKMNAVKKAINKYTAINTFIENGVRTSPLSKIVPCVGRSFKHTQGQNFWLCWEESQIETASAEGSEYFIEYIPVKQEYRVHVIGGKAVFVQKKYKQDRMSTAFMGIQGFQDYWCYEMYSLGVISTDAVNTAVNAVKALGLDFGGVDLLISMKDGRAYVAEVNTGPCLPNADTRKPYIDYFKLQMGW